MIEPSFEEGPVVDLRLRMSYAAFQHFASREGVTADRVWLVQADGQGLWSIATRGSFGTPVRSWGDSLVDRLPSRRASRPQDGGAS